MSTQDKFTQWAKGIGVISHSNATEQWVHETILLFQVQGLIKDAMLDLFIAADRIANAAMWLVVHMTYANKVKLDGGELSKDDFKINPQGHTGGSLNMVPAYVGYMLSNAVSGITRGWLMGQGHAVAAIDAVNLLLDNMRPEHAERYSLNDEGLSRFVQDFYSYKLDEAGNQDSPLGSHVNINTAGSILEGGYLGFADIQYIHMPLPGERLVAFLSDGAFEEQRGSDWAPRWWRPEDSGMVVPIMIFNGRRIDQRAMLSQGKGLDWFKKHLQIYSFEPVEFDGTDPAAFACMILKGERDLATRAKSALSSNKYPIMIPYGIAVAKKGAGFYGAGTNDAHGLPLGKNPRLDTLARNNFNEYADKMHIPAESLKKASLALQNHNTVHRLKERDNPIANRKIVLEKTPLLPFKEFAAGRYDLSMAEESCPMAAIDKVFLAFVEANPSLRPRVGNPDEISSNHLKETLKKLKHRVTEVETGMAEALDGAIITALNEEAVICACLGNKGGINLAVTYEAFGPKMLGALRQEIIWSDHLQSRNREAGWLSVPVVLTSNTFENGKNERSHQDPALCEALLNEPADLSRVLFPADYNSAAVALASCYQTHGKIFTYVIPKSENIPDLFTERDAFRLVDQGGITLQPEKLQKAEILLTAIGAYQLIETLKAAERLEKRGVKVAVNYLIEPGRFRHARGRRELNYCAPIELRLALFPEHISTRVFVCHTHPEVMSGILRPVDTGKNTVFL
ncbi:MAG: xylulose 5-phosphate 3-epimerase, partial [Nitrosomonadales bacterium]|nr:xylulose 5-phosphate 3-epimerase [Nitrosomonadales bacterium]